MGKRGPPRGTPKTEGSGRKMGTPNKDRQALLDRAKEKGLDIWGAMIELALEARGAEKFRMLAEMLQYGEPKKKAIEHSGGTKEIKVLEIKANDGSGIRMVDDDQTT